VLTLIGIGLAQQIGDARGLGVIQGRRPFDVAPPAQEQRGSQGPYQSA